MKIIISQEHIDKMKKLIEKYGINSLRIEPYRFVEMGLVEPIIDQMGLRSASEFLGMSKYELIEMGVVKSYDGDLYLDDPIVKSLGKLKFVEGFLNLANSKIESLGSLEEVGGNLNLFNTPIKDLGNRLIYVGGNLFLPFSKVESLGSLKYVGGYLYLRDTPLAELSDEEIRSQVKIKGDIIR